MEAVMKQEGADILNWANAAATYLGDVEAIQGNVPGVVASDAAIGNGAAYTTGVFNFAKAAGVTFALNAPVFWDVSGNTCITAPGEAADLFLGVCQVAAASADLVVKVALNCTGYGVVPGQVFVSPYMPSVDHASTDEYTIITAAQNVKGCALDIVGVITEQTAGDSEDQLTVGIYTEDDVEIASVQSANGSADAVGDRISAAQSMTLGTDGSAAALVPAGKSAYAKVKTATAGSGAAGKIVIIAKAIYYPN